MITKIKSLKNHQGFMKYFKNTSWLFAEKILRMVVGLFVGIWVARYLGPEQFGLFSYAQSFVALFTAFAALGLDSIVVRELVKDESRRDELIGTTFWLKMMGAIGVLSILAIAINFTSNDSYTNILVFIIASASIFQSFNVIDFYFQAKVLSKYVVFANTISLLVSSAVKILLILNQAPLVAFAWVVLFDSIILALGLIYFYFAQKHSFLFSEFKFHVSTAKFLLKDSWPLIFASMAMMMNQKIDQVMIKEFLDAEQVGYYAAAITLIDILILLPFVASKSIFPLFVKSYEVDKKRFEEKIVWAYRVFFLATLLPALGIYFLADGIIELLYGSVYSQSVEVLKIYCFLLLFSSIGAINMLYLRTLNLQKKAMNRQLSNVLINITLNYIYIPVYGIEAAAYTSLFSIIFTTIIYDLFDRNLKRINILKFISLTNYKGIK